jgi:hypothetical protein
MLLEPRSTDRRLFRAESVKQLFAEHRAKARDHGTRIWRLVNLEIWQRIMLDGEPVEAAAAHLSSSKPVIAG